MSGSNSNRNCAPGARTDPELRADTSIGGADDVGVIWECALRPKGQVEEVSVRVERCLKSREVEFVAGREWPGPRRDG